MSERLSNAEKSLPIMLLRARETVMQRFRPMLKAHGLSEQQWRVLRVLNEQGPSAPTTLASRAVILMPSLTRILANLAGRGLIERARHAEDGRRQVASLTSLGRDLIAEITPQSAAIYATLEAEFGADEVHDLMQALRRLAAL
ncbi:MAG: homoprotocatechuate degradation operon regulator HpaR [Alphaproteobacteria bacterium]|nr:homoprotocatechuate degradation operon regulator HpaR [Alphaproteobacteria bacterium]